MKIVDQTIVGITLATGFLCLVSGYPEPAIILGVIVILIALASEGTQHDNH